MNAFESLRKIPWTNAAAILKALLQVTSDIKSAPREMEKKAGCYTGKSNELETLMSNTEGKEAGATTAEEYSPGKQTESHHRTGGSYWATNPFCRIQESRLSPWVSHVHGKSASKVHLHEGSHQQDEGLLSVSTQIDSKDSGGS